MTLMALKDVLNISTGSQNFDNFHRGRIGTGSFTKFYKDFRTYRSQPYQLFLVERRSILEVLKAN